MIYKTYLLQILNSDFELQAKTEVSSETLNDLQAKASFMVKLNPIAKGMKYRIFSVIGNHSIGFDSKMLKEDVISL